MKYIIVRNNWVDLSAFQPNLETILLEINENGFVKREIGLDEESEIIHAYPSSKYRYGKYGIFDLNSFDISDIEESLNQAEFEAKWDIIKH